VEVDEAVPSAEIEARDVREPDTGGADYVGTGERVSMERDGPKPLAGGSDRPVLESTPWWPTIRKGSSRPPYVHPESWPLIGQSERKRMAAEWVKICERESKERDLMAQEDVRVGSSLAIAACCTEDEVLEWFPSESLATVAQELEFLDDGHCERPVVEGVGRTFVARRVGKAERLASPGAQAALRKEWDHLRAIKCWDESRVRESRDVEEEARQKGTVVHLAQIFAICHENNAELPEGHPSRKFKGRVVFQGNQFRDQDWCDAVFQDLSSSPATMEASKTLDAYGLFAGHEIQQADAEQAYTQSKLEGTPTWISLPEEEWPESWKGRFKNPVCPLLLALYGHPGSGGFLGVALQQTLGESWLCRHSRLEVVLLARAIACSSFRLR